MSDVHVGREGWLFLSGGANEVLKYYTERGHFAKRLESWIGLLERRMTKARRRGITYRHMIVPDKLSVYPEFSGLDLPFVDEAPSRSVISSVRGRTAQSVVDLLPVFHANKNKSQLYYKTDAHWTFEGAFLAYEALCNSLKAVADVKLSSVPRLSGNAILDLGSKLEPPVSELYSSAQVVSSAMRVSANAMVHVKEVIGQPDAGGLHVGSSVVYRNVTAQDRRKIILFGDSYSEYREHLLTGLLAETFAEVHFVWSAAIDWNYVDRVKPDIVVTELAERFMSSVPEDALELDAFVSARIEQFRGLGHISALPAMQTARQLKKSIDLVGSFQTMHAIGLGHAGGAGEVIFRSRAEFLEDAIIRLRCGSEDIYAGLGLASDDVATYCFEDDGYVSGVLRLPLVSIAQAVRASRREPLYLTSSRSVFPLAVVSSASWSGMPAKLEYLERLEARLDRTHWGIDAIFLADGELHVIGWATPPTGANGAQPIISIDGEVAQFISSAPVGATALYWFMDGAERMGFYVKGPSVREWGFCKFELTFEADPPQTLTLRRFPIFNWVGDFSHFHLPDDENIHRVSGPSANSISYLNGGYSDYARFRSLVENHGLQLTPGHTRILDWGCGCARIARHFIAEGLNLTGIDIDQGNIEWCRGAFPTAVFEVVPLRPPTTLAADAYDIIISSSVLSHLSEPVMDAWLEEISRVLSSDGLAFLSYNGDGTSFVYGSVFPPAVDALEANGFFDEWRTPDLDLVTAEPDYYRLTLMTDERANAIFSKRFELVSIVRGVTSGHQNIAVLRKR